MYKNKDVYIGRYQKLSKITYYIKIIDLEEEWRIFIGDSCQLDKRLVSQVIGWALAVE